MKEDLIKGLNLSLNAYSVGCTALMKAIEDVAIDMTNIKNAHESVSCKIEFYNWVIRWNGDGKEEPIIGIKVYSNGEAIYAVNKSDEEISLEDLDGNTLFEIVNVLIELNSNY